MPNRKKEFWTRKKIQSSNLGGVSCDGSCMVRFKCYGEHWVCHMARFVKKRPFDGSNQWHWSEKFCTWPLFQVVSSLCRKLAWANASFRNIQKFPYDSYIRRGSCQTRHFRLNLAITRLNIWKYRPCEHRGSHQTRFWGTKWGVY